MWSCEWNARRGKFTNPGQTIPLGWIAGPLGHAGVLGATLYCATRRTVWASVLWVLLAITTGLALAMGMVLGLHIPMTSVVERMQQSGTP